MDPVVARRGWLEAVPGAGVPGVLSRVLFTRALSGSVVSAGTRAPVVSQATAAESAARGGVGAR